MKAAGRSFNRIIAFIVDDSSASVDEAHNWTGKERVELLSFSHNRFGSEPRDLFPIVQVLLR